jgi:hypothetical protein
VTRQFDFATSSLRLMSSLHDNQVSLSALGYSSNFQAASALVHAAFARPVADLPAHVMRQSPAYDASQSSWEARAFIYVSGPVGLPHGAFGSVSDFTLRLRPLLQRPRFTHAHSERI